MRRRAFMARKPVFSQSVHWPWTTNFQYRRNPARCEPRANSRPLYIRTVGGAVGAEVLNTIVGFLCRVPSVRNEEIALFSQQMTFWRGTANPPGCFSGRYDRRAGLR